MKNRDNELDKLLAPLRQSQPSPEQMAKWQALAPAPLRRHPFMRRVVEMAVACAAGFAIASVYYKNTAAPQVVEVSTQVAQNNFDPDATIERVYVKNQ